MRVKRLRCYGDNSSAFVMKQPGACIISSFVFVLIGIICSGSAGPVFKTRENNIITDNGWIQLFDGHTLKGWHSYGQKAPGAAWSADDGSIHLKPGTKKGYQTTNGGDLVTDDVFDNFMLELEWKVSRSANSGLIFYVQEDTVKYKETWHTGFEVQVCDNEYNVDAHVYKRDAGAVYDLVPVTKEAAKGYGEWNRVEMTSDNGKVTIRLNEIQNLSFDTKSKEWKESIAGSKFRNMPGFGLFESGHIALQDHGQEVWFRKIRVKRL